MAQNIIDYITSFVILIGVLVFAITATVGVLNNYYIYQKNLQINGVATDLLNNLLQNTGYPNDWGRQGYNSTNPTDFGYPTNFGLRWTYAQGIEPSPFAPLRLMNTTSIANANKSFKYIGDEKDYINIGPESTSIWIRELDRFKYSDASKLLGIQGIYGWRIQYKPIVNVKIEKTFGPNADWYPRDPATRSDWLYRKEIKINSLASALLNYQVLIQTTIDPTHAQKNGNDFLFTDSNAVTKLNHDIESYNNSTGTLTAWVKIPVLPSNGTKIYIYYGNPDIAIGNQQNADQVWNSYILVQHMSEFNPTSITITDSSINDNDGTKKGVNEPLEGLGKIADAQVFDGADDCLQLETASSESEVTYEMWLKNTLQPTSQEILSDGITSTSNGFTDISRPPSSDDLIFDYAPSNGLRTVPDFFKDLNNQWVHLVIVVDYPNKSVDVYRNGVNFASIIPTSIIQPILTPKYIGAFNTSSSFYSGLIDEFRICSGKLSPNWIETSYNNQNSPLTFMTIGPEEDGRLELIVTATGPSGPVKGADVVLSLIHSEGSGETLSLTQENAAFGKTNVNGQVIIPKSAWTGSGTHLYLAIAKVTVGGMVCAGNLFEQRIIKPLNETLVRPIITNYEKGNLTLVHTHDVNPSFNFDGNVTYAAAIVIPVANDEYRPVLLSSSTGVIKTGEPAVLNLGSVKDTPGAILLLYKASDGTLSATLTPWDVGSLGLTATFGGKGLDATNIVTKYNYATIAGVSYEIKIELWKEGGF